MCGFTLITYTECGHQVLSTSAENTCLCRRTKLVHLVQGIDCAPAICVPTHDTDTLIFANNTIFGHCDDYCAKACAQKQTERGELDDVLQVHAHAQEEDIGFYNEVEIDQTHDLCNLIQQKLFHGMSLADELDSFLSANSHARAYITNDRLRTLLSREGAEKYSVMYLNAFRQCAEMVPILEAYIQQRVPNEPFVKTFAFLHDKAKKAENSLLIFEVIVDCLLRYEPSRPTEHFNGSKSRLEYFADVFWRLITGAGPDAPPCDLYMYKPDAKITKSISPEVGIKEALHQAHTDAPTERAIQK
jgi:hypothetical protein